MKTIIHRHSNRHNHPFTTAVRRSACAAVLLAAAALLPMGTPDARAAAGFPNTYWDPGRTGTRPGSGGSGVWDLTTANWVSTSGSGDVPYPTPNGGAILAGAAGTVSLNASGISGTYLELDTAGYVVQDAPGTNYALSLSQGITVGNTTGTVTVSVPVNLTNPNPSGGLSSNGGTLAVTGNLTASGQLNIFGGTVVLSGNNSIAGLTNVAGTLQLAGTGTNQPLGGTTNIEIGRGDTLLYGASNQVPAGTPVAMFGGTFNVNGNSQSLAARLGVLTVPGGYTAALDFGAGVSAGSVLAFVNSSGASWSGTSTLNVYDYRGTPGTGGGVDQLYFGADATGLTTAQLGEINFYSGGAGSALLGTGVILSDGEVTYGGTVPEPATWLGGALLLGAAGRIGLRRRRRSGV